MLTAFVQKENLYKNCYSTFQAVGSSTNEHHNDATVHACALGVHEWNGICEHKISDSKHIDGRRVCGFVALSVQLPPTWLVRHDVVLLRAAR